MFLSLRQQSILNRVIDAYIETGQPVGSRYITDLYTGLYRGSYSPATVRYEMLALEEKGYLTQPHTSAGRVPTDNGYRYYVDHSLCFEPMDGRLFQKMRQDLLPETGELENFCEKVSFLLSELSGQVSMIHLGSRKKPALFMRGLEYLSQHEEFTRVEIRSLLKALDEKTELIQLFSNRDRDLSISIGKENQTAAFNNCTMITAQIYSQGEYVGALAVLGPKRMRYARAVPTVRQAAQTVTDILNDFNQER